MFTLTHFIAATIVIGFVGSTFSLAVAVIRIIFAMLFPLVAISIVLTAIALVTARNCIKK